MRNARTRLAALLTLVAAGACARDGAERDVDSAATARAAPISDSASARAGARRVIVNGVDLTGVGYDVGNPDAPIILVNFSDFGCPYCGSFARETDPVLRKEFVETGQVFLKYVPFVMGMFPNGGEAARAAECAADQGKFWPMHDRLYADQVGWKTTRDPHPLFRRYGASIGLDDALFSACYSDRRTDGRTRQATDRADRLHIRATPTFYVNDRQIEGALPLDGFRQVLGASSARSQAQPLTSTAGDPGA